MSRFIKQVKNLEFAWGFDPPLSEYFFQCFDLDKKLEEDDCVFSISSYNTLTPHPDKPSKYGYSNSEMLEMMKKYPDVVPKEHLNAIAADLPF